jgi:hypothetical protein
MRNEPALIIGALEAAVIAVIGLLAVILGWDDNLKVAAVSAGAAIVAVIGAVWTRSSVYSPATYDADVNTALYTLPPDRE